MKDQSDPLHHRRLAKSLVVCSSLTAIFTGFASAAVMKTNDLSDPHRVKQVLFQEDASQMAGMQVTVSFSDTTTQTATWEALSLTLGAASNTGFRLSDQGDTFFTPWTLVNLHESAAITGFSLDGLPGNTGFDRTLPSFGTQDSDRGKDFFFESDPISAAMMADVDYSSPIYVGGNPVEGDLYHNLDVAFTMDTSLAPGTRLQFHQDTDIVLAIPEPSAGLGIGLLLSSAFFLRRRK